MKRRTKYLLICLIMTYTAVAVAEDEGLIRIPAGEFTMGSEKRALDERPTHKVYLDAYDIGKHEVTNAEYLEFWKVTGQHTPESFSDEFGVGTWPERASKTPNHPVVGVSWYDAVAYAEWKGMRLPTEAEWEKAARGPTDRIWPWGNSLEHHANAWSDGDGSQNGIALVGSYPNGKSYYGAMDMAGNAWEWTADWYSDAYYRYSPNQNPKGPETGSWRVIRGGSWVDDINRCSTTFRLQFYPGLKSSFIGFRLARTANAQMDK